MYYSRRFQGNTELTDEDMRKFASAIFAEAAKGDVSEKYQFVPTIDVISQLRGEGWKPVQVQQARVIKEENAGFQKHLVRFKHDELSFHDEAIQAVLINSHNRSAAYQLRTGVFRFICCNGLICGDTFEKFSVKHIGDGATADQVLSATRQISGNAEAVAGSIAEMKDMELSPDEQGVFSLAASRLIVEDNEELPFNPARLNTPRRQLDAGGDLWRTFNRVQENVIKGGIRYIKKGEWKRHSTRKVTSIDRNVKLNQALWTLAEEMKKIKEAS
jgi:hypothetical protein